MTGERFELCPPISTKFGWSNRMRSLDARSGDPARQQLAVLDHRTGEWADSDDFAGDLYHLGHAPHHALADDQPRTLPNERRKGIPGLVEEPQVHNS